MKQKGFAPLIIVFLVAIITTGVFAYKQAAKNTQQTKEQSADSREVDPEIQDQENIQNEGEFITNQTPTTTTSPTSKDNLPLQKKRTPELQPTFDKGTYHDPKLGYSLTVPDDWRAIENYPGVLISPDADGTIGYVDIAGMAIVVDRHTNDTPASLTDWLSQTDESDPGLYVAESRQTEILGSPSVHYEGSSDTEGNFIGLLVSVDTDILAIRCFHPKQETKGCLAMLPMVLQTLQLDR